MPLLQTDGKAFFHLGPARLLYAKMEWFSQESMEAALAGAIHPQSKLKYLPTWQSGRGAARL